MGDRCYMQIACRRQDQSRFEALGFVLESEPASISALVEMVDEQANYGHSGRLPADIPFVGWNGAGSNYGEGRVVCDGRELVEVCGSPDGFLVGWDKKKNRPDQKCLARVRRFLRVEKTLRRIFKNPPTT